jgi:NitT/TauT family transport system permease protein
MSRSVATDLQGDLAERPGEASSLEGDAKDGRLGAARGAGESRTAATLPWWRPAQGRRRVKVLLGQLVVLGVILGGWQLFPSLGWVNKSFSSQPSAIWSAVFAYYHSGRMLSSTAATMEAVAISFAIGTVVGTLVGFILGMNEFLDRVVGPLLVPVNSIPRIALAPLFILWFGLTINAKVALAVSIVFFILVLNARAAVKSVDPDLITMGRVIGMGRAAMLRKIIYPSSVPAVFAGIRLAITYSLLGVVGSEIIAARNGLGQDIMFYSNQFDIAGMFAVLLELAVLATLINLIFEYLERRLLRWQQP